MTDPKAGGSPAGNDIIQLGDQRLELVKHPTDFTVLGNSTLLEARGVKASRPIGRDVRRVEAEDSEARDRLMEEVRRDGVAHHVYRVAATGEEIVIDDHLLVTLEDDDPARLAELAEEFALIPEGHLGAARLLKVTASTGSNPLKVAQKVLSCSGVVSCHPQLLVEQQLSGPGPRFR